MIRMKVFKFSMSSFDYSHQEKEQQNDLSEKVQDKYQKKLVLRQDEYDPIEEFIDKVGFENVRKITTTSAYVGTLVYTVFYEDNEQGPQ